MAEVERLLRPSFFILGPMRLSVIIPTFNEADKLTRLLSYLQTQMGEDLYSEVILVDGGSQDGTAELATEMGVGVIRSKVKQRAFQMNLGASAARGDILYFLHADTLPPDDFISYILQAIQAGERAGCFRLSFDSKHWFLRCHSWLTRFNWDGFHYGDQSLFVYREVFDELGGFNESLDIMEDYDLVRRLKQRASFIVLPKAVVTSARRYREVGVFRLQLLYYLIFALFRIGLSQKNLWKVYRFCFK